MTPEQYVDAVRLMPCCADGCGLKPVTAHHVVGGSLLAKIGVRGRKKHSDYLAIPLCHDHHQGARGIHTIGVENWEERYGAQVDHVDGTGEHIGVHPWAAAKAERHEARACKKYKKPPKVMPRRHAA